MSDNEQTFDWSAFLESQSDWIEEQRQGDPDRRPANEPTTPRQKNKDDTTRRKPMANYSQATLDRLTAMPINQLTAGQLRSARKYKARQVNDQAWTMEAERLIEENRHRSLDDLYEAVRKVASAYASTQPTDGTGPGEWLTELPEDLAKPTSDIKYTDTAQACREHAGLWKLWREYPDRARAKAVARNIRRGLPTAFTRGQFDAKAIENPKGTHKVYIAYRKAA